MQIPQTEAERVQFLISLGRQPGVGAWFTVWRIATRRRERTAPRRAAKPMPQGSCAA
ncbi:MAG TPA: hypothetical protein VF651_06180 [Gammaproteobacteria bacterium]